MISQTLIPRHSEVCREDSSGVALQPGLCIPLPPSTMANIQLEPKQLRPVVSTPPLFQRKRITIYSFPGPKLSKY